MRCVVGFLRDKKDRVVFIRKRKPDWQKGLLNGVGGKCEIISQERRPNGHIAWEDPLKCMEREWAEEMGIAGSGLAIDWQPFATIIERNATVYFFKAEIDQLPLFDNNNDAGEPIEVHARQYVQCGYFTPMVKNLSWLLPLAFDDANRWSVEAVRVYKEAA